MSTASTPNATPTKSKGNGRILTFWGSIIGLALLAMIVPYMLFVEAPPPRKIIMATGSKEGAYYQFALRYAQFLKKEGLALEIRETKGSVENLKLLQDDSAGIAVAIVQSGVAGPGDADNLVALGSLYREPLWVFYRGQKPLDRISALVGLRVAIGPEGSGTRAIALQLLAANGLVEMKEGSISSPKVTLLPESGTEAARALKKGDIDAAFFVAAIDAAYLPDLVMTEGIRLMSFAQHDAYQRRYRFLSSMTVPAGLVDLGKNVPAKDIHLIAPTATLVVRKDVHPAVESILLTAATKIHGPGDLFTKPGEFPASSFTDLPISETAEHYYKHGPPVLQRLLPFWLASLVDRLKIMLIPLIMLLMPLIRAAPPLVHWRTRRKIYRWYASLRAIDQKLVADLSGPELNDQLAKLRDIEYRINHVDVPLSYMKELYHLRLHLKMVHEKLERLLSERGEVY